MISVLYVIHFVSPFNLKKSIYVFFYQSFFYLSIASSFSLKIRRCEKGVRRQRIQINFL